MRDLAGLAANKETTMNVFTGELGRTMILVLLGEEWWPTCSWQIEGTNRLDRDRGGDSAIGVYIASWPATPQPGGHRGLGRDRRTGA